MAGLVSIRNAVSSDIPCIIKLINSVGRMVGHDQEISTWMRVDPKGFFVAQVGKDNVIGLTSAVNLSSSRCFFGLGIVHEDYRRRGVLSELFKRCFEHAGPRNIGCWAESDVFGFLEKVRGFRHVQDGKSVRYSCDSIVMPLADPSLGGIRSVPVSVMHQDVRRDQFPHFWSEAQHSPSKLAALHIKVDLKKTKRGNPMGGGEGGGAASSPARTIVIDKTLCKIDKTSSSDRDSSSQRPRAELSETTHRNGNGYISNEELLVKMTRYDRLLHGYNRSLALKGTVLCPRNVTRVALLDDTVVGYACLRPVITDRVLISPFYADSALSAEVLLRDLLQTLKLSKCDKGLVVYVPDVNEAGRRLLERYGFVCDGVTLWSGYTKAKVEVNYSHIFGFYSMSFCGE